MKVLILHVTSCILLGLSLVSASYKHNGYYKKGQKCYQCAWSPPKVAYATVKKPVTYGSSPRQYGKSSYSTVVNYGVKKVPVKVQGGWDKCHDAFSKYQANKYGIDQWECEHNCYTRTDKNGNLYRGCYKGEYNVNPKKLGRHYQAGSLYCFCAGELCNNKDAPEHKYFQKTQDSTYYSYDVSPKSNYGSLDSYNYNPRVHNFPKHGFMYRGVPFVGYNYDYPRRPLAYKKAFAFDNFDSEENYNNEFKENKKSKDSSDESYGKEFKENNHFSKYDKKFDDKYDDKYKKFDKDFEKYHIKFDDKYDDKYKKLEKVIKLVRYDKYDKYGDALRKPANKYDHEKLNKNEFVKEERYVKEDRYDNKNRYTNENKYEHRNKYDKFDNKKRYDSIDESRYDSMEYGPKSRSSPERRDISDERDHPPQGGISHFNNHDSSEEFKTYKVRKPRKYDSYEGGKIFEFDPKYKMFENPPKATFAAIYAKPERYTDRRKGDYHPKYLFRSSRDGPIKHYIHPIKEKHH